MDYESNEPQKSLLFLTHNIRSIPSNIVEFYVDFEGLDIDVLGLCDTSLSDSIESIYLMLGMICILSLDTLMVEVQ